MSKGKIEVLKNGDMDGLIAYTTGQPVPAKAPEPKAEEKLTEAAAEKPAEGLKPGQLREGDWQDELDENGIHPTEKEGLTEKMKKAIGRRQAALTDAQKFATAEHNRAELERQRADKAQRELEELKGKQPAEPAKPAEAGKPKRADFDSDEAYAEAVIDYRVGLQLEKERKQAQEKAEADARAATVKSAEERIAKAKELIADFDQLVSNANLQFGDTVNDAIVESELFPEIAYYLAQHPDEIASIQKMTIKRALVAIGKIEGKLSPFAPSGPKPQATAAKPTESKTDGQSKPAEGSKPTAPATTAVEVRPTQTRDVPVLSTLPASSDSQVSPVAANTQAVVEAYGQEKGVNLYKRRRH